MWESPKSVAGYWDVCSEYLEPVLELKYSDSTLNNWFIELRKILADPKLHKKAIAEQIRQQEIDDVEYEQERAWHIDLDKLSDVFKPCKVPDELVKLAKYQNKKASFVMNPLNLVDNGNEYGNVEQLKWFASTGDGSGIAYWVKKDIENSPIVYINHDVEGSQVLARNIRELYGLIISGPSVRKTERKLELLFLDLKILSDSNVFPAPAYNEFLDKTTTTKKCRSSIVDNRQSF